MKDLQVITIQYDIISNQPQQNRETISSLITDAVNASPKKNEEGESLITLAVLPEMMTCGFSLDSHQCAEDADSSESIVFIKGLAKQYGIYICGSLPIRENGKIYNRCIFVSPEGTISKYDKKHLFSIGFEREAYTDGVERVITDCEGWKIMLSVCYDVRFPVWLRNRCNEYDVLINVANWPTVRIEGWNTLLRARAIENLAYVVGVNRTGKDAFDADYPNASKIIDFKGNVISINDRTNGFASAIFSHSKLSQFRKKFAVWKDADEFEITQKE